LAPALTSPDDGATVGSLKPTFDWEDVDDSTGYTLQISTKSSMKSASSYNIATSTYTPGKNLAANKTLYWRVRSKGVNGPSLWSEVRSIVTPGS
jgi:hypothetical protein